MGKNVVVNGKTYNDKSIVRLFATNGNAVLFKDVDEISSIAGLAEIACGTFTVEKATGGGTPSQGTSFVVAHGMNGTPDGWYIVPKHWHDTTESQHALAAWHRASASDCFIGRRSLASGTAHQGGAVAATTMQADSTYIYPRTSTLAAFQPTYTDAEGNVKPQEYIWVAFRFAE